MASDPVIGIDLGTTNSVVASVIDGKATVLRTRTGQTLTPSIVAYTTAGKRLVGPLAKRQAATNPERTLFASKRLIGRKFSSPQVQQALRYLPYPVVAGEHDDVRVQLSEQTLSVPEISAAVLRELKADAEAFFGTAVNRAVITVPAYFNDGQRQATRDAGVIAGLDVLRIINEPTAAALAYGFGDKLEGLLAVFDLGGGTFDVSVLEVSGGIFEVIATGGDTFLGGEDFDHRILDWLAKRFEDEYGVDLKKDRFALQRLKDAAENAKIQLSTARELTVDLPFIFSPKSGGALHLHATLTRAELESLTKDLVERAITLCDQVLASARVKPIDLREMILVGGMTRMPQVMAAVEKAFRRAPCVGINPDEVVALGAAVQASALVERAHEVVLLDVTPLSLGVAVAGGYVRHLIPRNTTVPTSVTETFNTSRDGQTSVKILVLQGESPLAHENELLGEFILTGLRHGLRGEVHVDVRFDINADGVVLVSAHDKETGREQSIAVTASGGLTRTELAAILDKQADDFLEARASDELVARRAELQTLVNEVTALLPDLERYTRETGFGSEAIAKARGALHSGEETLKRGSALAIVVTSIDALQRTTGVLRAISASLKR